MVILDGGNLRDTVIDDNIYIRSHNIPESGYLILLSLHIGREKCRIYSIKTETDTNITIQRMNERIKSNSILEVVDDERVNSLTHKSKMCIDSARGQIPHYKYYKFHETCLL